MHITCQRALKRKDTSAASKIFCIGLHVISYPSQSREKVEGKLIEIRVATR